MSFLGKNLCCVCRSVLPALGRASRVSGRAMRSTEKFPHIQSVSVLPQLFTNFVQSYSSKRPNSVHGKDAAVKGEGEDMYEPQSPYRTHWPRQYGYTRGQIFTGGILPRVDNKVGSLPKYKVRNNWSKERALFGQNDYIDILGDGDVHPVDLIQGPSWIRGFNGNEYQRLIRRMRMQGSKLRTLYPTQYKLMWKRIHFLHKKYNHKRAPRVR